MCVQIYLLLMCAEIQIVNINGHQGGVECFLSIFECRHRATSTVSQKICWWLPSIVRASHSVVCSNHNVRLASHGRYGSLVAAVIVRLVDSHRKEGGSWSNQRSSCQLRPNLFTAVSLISEKRFCELSPTEKQGHSREGPPLVSHHCVFVCPTHGYTCCACLPAYYRHAGAEQGTFSIFFPT